MASKKDLQNMEAAVRARAKSRAPQDDPGAGAPAPLGEYHVLNCERENFLGDAKIFMHLHRGKALYVHQQEKWLRWDGHHWQPDINASYALSLVEDVAQEYLRVAGIFGKQAKDTEEQGDKAGAKSMADKRDSLYARAKRCRGKDRKAVLDFVHSGPETLSIAGSELDSDPWLLGVANGVLDLRTGDLRPGRPEDYITRASPTEWQGPDADSKPFRDFLADILSDDPALVDFMLRFLGMALLGRQREHKFLVLFGPGGRNGKDTLMSILTDVLGEQLCSPVPMEMFMEQQFLKDYSKGNPVDMSLRGKRLVYASETSKRHKFSGETMKNLTGGGKMEARGLHENHITSWERSHTIVLLTNELPSAAADDDAFWERLLGVELRRRFVDNPDASKPEERPKNPDLREEMKDVGPGIMAALVAGFQDYLKDGLRPPPVVESFKESYRKAEDLIGNFLDDCCDVYTDQASLDDPLQRTPAKVLQECFAWWFKGAVSKKVPGPRFFNNGMARKGHESKKISSNFYLGIVIKPEVANEWAADKEKEREERRGK